MDQHHNKTWIKCPACSTLNDNDSDFCSECGEKLKIKKSAGDGAKCRRCGTINRAGATFCADCGKNLFTGRNPKKRKKRKLAHKVLKGSRGIVRSTRSQGIRKTAKKETSHILRTIDDLSGGKLRKLDQRYYHKKRSNRHGYLVCDRCYGYYELEEGVSPHKYKTCACGGNLSYYRRLPEY